VEGEIELRLSTLLRQPIDIVGAGRTDAGVHARHMVAHFDFEDGCDTKQLCYRLNRMMPPDICIYKIEKVADDLHARFSATSRTYHYYISTKRNPFNRQYTWLCHYDLDFELMNQAAEILMEYKDFASFCKSHTDVKTTLCNIIEAKWIKDDEGCYYFRIKANRFLRNMVRAVVGTLVKVGRHRLSLDDFRNVIEGKKRTMAGESMPANALFLEKIEY
jgi:tRNA pseudouridine38-40 synthase